MMSFFFPSSTFWENRFLFQAGHPAHRIGTKEQQHTHEKKLPENGFYKRLKNLKKDIESEQKEKKINAIIESAKNIRSSLGAAHILQMQSIIDTSGSKRNVVQEMFLENGTVDFHGNAEAEAEIGFGHMYDREQNPFVKVTKADGTVQFGQRGIYKNKKGYLDIRAGTNKSSPHFDYLEAKTGYSIQLFSSYEEMKKNMQSSSYTEKPLEESQVLLSSEKEERAADKRHISILMEQEKAAQEFIQTLNANDADPKNIEDTLSHMPAKTLAKVIRKMGPKQFRLQIRKRGLENTKANIPKLKRGISDAVNIYFFNRSSSEKKEIKKAIWALVAPESGGKKFAVSSTGALGPLQILASNYLHYNENPFQENEATDIAVQVFKTFFDDAQKQGAVNTSEAIKGAVRGYFSGYAGVRNPNYTPENQISAQEYQRNWEQSLSQTTEDFSKKEYEQNSALTTVNVRNVQQTINGKRVTVLRSTSTIPEVGGLIYGDLVRAATAFYKKFGKPFQITSGYRSFSKQKKLYEKSQHGGAKAAPPGYSYHNVGVAIDINQNTMNTLGSRSKVYAFMQSFGFQFISIPGENWHFEHKSRTMFKNREQRRATAKKMDALRNR